MKLNSIDNMRVDGKFLVGEDIPEGQGSVNDLLAECFELSYDLRVEAEDESEMECEKEKEPEKAPEKENVKQTVAEDVNA